MKVAEITASLAVCTMARFVLPASVMRVPGRADGPIIRSTSIIASTLSAALGQFMLDLHTNEHGYAEVAPPLLVRDHVMFGTAQLPKFEQDQFFAIPDLVIETDLLLQNLEYAEEKGTKKYA